MSELEKINTDYKKRFKELQDEYKKKIDTLQKKCKHSDISNWLVEIDENGMGTTVCVKGCGICGKKLMRKDYRLISVDELPYAFQPGPVKGIADRLLKEGRAKDLNEAVRIYYEEL